MASNDQNKIFLTLLLIVTICTSRTVHSQKLPESSLAEKYEKWIAKYSKVYKDVSEKEKRFEIFKKNVEYIESFNSNGTKTFKLSVNEFADLTNEEFSATYKGFMRSHSGSTKIKSLFKYENVTDLPDSVDWVQKGAVSPVMHQGNCNSCWAFSATAAIEGIHQITTGELVPLSKQMLVDCDYTNGGCAGGSMTRAFRFIINNGGITTEENYPYKAYQGLCDTSKLASHDVQISDFEHVPASELELQKAVANQPVSLAVDSSSNAFTYYRGGLFEGKCGNSPDHAVAAVGYGKTDDGTEYWLVKNSWGTQWGEGGYIRMKRNVDDRGGLCGIAMFASYPII